MSNKHERELAGKVAAAKMPSKGRPEMAARAHIKSN